MLIPGRQVRLRDWEARDLERYREAMQPGQEWQRLDGPYYPRPQGAELEASLERIAARVERGDWPEPRVQLVVADSETDEMLGRVSRYWLSEETWWLALGVGLFDASRWGRGIGHEALGLWTSYMFESIPELARLDLRTWSGNGGMMRLAEKLGYRLEACFRKARVVDGEHFDGLGYGVLREEWAERYPQGFASELGADS